MFDHSNTNTNTNEEQSEFIVTLWGGRSLVLCLIINKIEVGRLFPLPPLQNPNIQSCKNIKTSDHKQSNKVSSLLPRSTWFDQEWWTEPSRSIILYSHSTAWNCVKQHCVHFVTIQWKLFQHERSRSSFWTQVRSRFLLSFYTPAIFMVPFLENFEMSSFPDFQIQPTPIITTLSLQLIVFISECDK